MRTVCLWHPAMMPDAASYNAAVLEFTDMYRDVEGSSGPRALTPEELAIVRTVLYASLFDYPLTTGELRQALIQGTLDETEIERLYRSSDVLRRLVARREGFFLPQGRPDLVDRRRERERTSGRALAAHRRLLRCACAVPFTRLVALSGSAAHLNMDGGADVDLFVITRGRHVWSVTLLIVLLAKLMGQRPTLCVNLVMSDDRLRVLQEDLFTANQIIHLKPLIGSDTLERFIAANPFVAAWYPNGRVDGRYERYAPGRAVARAKRLLETMLGLGPGAVCEWLARTTYRPYLRRRLAGSATPERVQLLCDCVKLHASSHRDAVLRRFEERLTVTLRALD
jgi:hypothetical protein